MSGSSPGLYFSDRSSVEHDPRVAMRGHPENPERLLAIERRLAQADWLGWERRPAPAASEAWLELVHGARHVRAIRELCEAGGGAIDADTYAGARSYEAARHAAGGACALTAALLAGEAQLGFCAARPPGHHAEADRAMGFCLFDSVAVAAELALRELGARRIFILDWDVHHGNGTAEIFRERADVLYASIHEGGIFPGTGPLEDVGSGAGEGYTLNLPVPAGADGGLWLGLLEHVIVPAASAFEPDLILISAGFDGHRLDPLANCCLETEDFAALAAHARELARRLGVPLGAVLEGGYEPDALAECVQATLAALAGEGEAPLGAPESPFTARARERIGRFWPL